MSVSCLGEPFQNLNVLLARHPHIQKQAEPETLGEGPALEETASTGKMAALTSCFKSGSQFPWPIHGHVQLLPSPSPLCPLLRAMGWTKQISIRSAPIPGRMKPGRDPSPIP